MEKDEWRVEAKHGANIEEIEEILKALLSEVDAEPSGVLQSFFTDSRATLGYRELQNLFFYTVCVHITETGESLTDARFAHEATGVFSREVEIALQSLEEESYITNTPRDAMGEASYRIDSGIVVGISPTVQQAVEQAMDAYNTHGFDDLEQWSLVALPGSFPADSEVIEQSELTDLPSLM